MDEFVVDLDKVLDDFEATLDNNCHQDALSTSQITQEETRISSVKLTSVQGQIHPNNSDLGLPFEEGSHDSNPQSYIMANKEEFLSTSNIPLKVNNNFLENEHFSKRYEPSNMVDLDQLLDDFQGTLYPPDSLPSVRIGENESSHMPLSLGKHHDQVKASSIRDIHFIEGPNHTDKLSDGVNDFDKSTTVIEDHTVMSDPNEMSVANTNESHIHGGDCSEKNFSLLTNESMSSLSKEILVERQDDPVVVKPMHEDLIIQPVAIKGENSVLVKEKPVATFSRDSDLSEKITSNSLCDKESIINVHMQDNQLTNAEQSDLVMLNDTDVHVSHEFEEHFTNKDILQQMLTMNGESGRLPPSYDEALRFSLVLNPLQRDEPTNLINIPTGVSKEVYSMGQTTNCSDEDNHNETSPHPVSTKTYIPSSEHAIHTGDNVTEFPLLAKPHCDSISSFAPSVGSSQQEIQQSKESSITYETHSIPQMPMSDFYHIHFEDSIESVSEIGPSQCISGASINPVISLEENEGITTQDASSTTVTEPSLQTSEGTLLTHSSSTEEGSSTDVQWEPAPAIHVPVCAWNGGLAEHQVGLMEPKWAPDNSSAVCMVCALKFTVIRRRHHCRACGQLLCSACCSWWMPLAFLNNAKGRVCACCYQQLVRLESANLRQNQNTRDSTPSASPNPAVSTASLNTSIGPPTSALKRSRASNILGSTSTSILSNDPSVLEPSISTSKSVCFSDGVRPGRDLKEVPVGESEPLKSSPPLPSARSSLLSSSPKDRVRTSTVNVDHSGASIALLDTLETCYLPNWNEDALKGVSNVDVPLPLPPVVQMMTDGMRFQMLPDLQGVVDELATANLTKCSFEVRFAVSPHCHVRVSRWRMRPNEQGPIAWKNPDASDVCWRFISHGMQTVGQQEIVLLLECPPDELLPPMAVMRLFYQFYIYAQRTDVTGHSSPLHEFGCYVPSSISGGSSVDRLPFPCGAGVLFVTLRHLATFVRSTTTWQSSMLRDLPSDCVLGLLIHECELVWARLLPQRVLYRMGMAAQCYPHPLLSQRYRASLFGDVGHTLFRLLADFQSYRYTVNTVAALTISLFPDGLIRVEVPKSSYGQIMRVLNERADDSSVLAFGAIFNMAADSHLTCVQNTDTDQYSTEAITASSTYPQITGASFIVFNGGQRNTGGSLVEDGVLIQMGSGQFQELLLSLTGMRDFVMPCPSTASPHASPLRKIALMESANAPLPKQPIKPEVSSNGNSQGLLQIIWLEDDGDRVINHATLTRGSWIDGRTLVVDNGYAGAIYGHSGCSMQAEVSYRVPTEYRLRHSLTSLSEMGTINLMDRTRDKVYGVAFVRVFVLHCPTGCEDRGTRELVDPLHVCEPIAEAFIKFLLPFAEVASSCNVTGIALRVTLDPELVGYSVGCCDWCDDRMVRGLPECCTMEGSLDDALIPVVHPTASRIVHGPLELELIFYLVSL